MSKDHHAQGQHDREAARDDSFTDILIHGGNSSTYDPPGDSDAKDDYNAGWENAERK